jgi:hypothetical protein
MSTKKNPHFIKGPEHPEWEEQVQRAREALRCLRPGSDSLRRRQMALLSNTHQRVPLKYLGALLDAALK